MKIFNFTLLNNGNKFENAALEFENKIKNITFNFPGQEGIDLNGMYISPGYVDVHIHGVNGFDASEPSFETYRGMEEFLYSKGVTSFLPSTVSIPHKDIMQVIQTIREYMKENPDTSVSGVHLEGPFFNIERKGAQNPDYIRSPSDSEINDIKNNSDVVRIISLAPELDNCVKAIKEFSAAGINVSIGHTKCNYAQSMEALNHGANRFTHLFNAMNPIHHRDIGTVGAGLMSDAYVELICDLIHLSPEAIKMVYKIKDKDKIVLITDAMRATGLEPGMYDLGGLEVFVSNQDARLKDGSLAGSVLTMDKAVKNTVKASGQSPAEVLKASTINPAKSAGIDAGILDIGKASDFVILDSDLNIISTVKNGKIMYGEKIF